MTRKVMKATTQLSIARMEAGQLREWAFEPGDAVPVTTPGYDKLVAAGSVAPDKEE
jgi:hypothetical protein